MRALFYLVLPVLVDGCSTMIRGSSQSVSSS